MKHTIKASADIDNLFKAGRRGASGLMLVLWLDTPEARDPKTGRVLFVAGKKLGNAVVRNRCKRLLRETASRAGAPWPGLDVAFVARPGLPTAAPATLDAAMLEALQKAGVVR